MGVDWKDLLEKAKAIQREAMRERDFLGYQLAGRDVAFYEMMAGVKA